ncbi:MAG: xylulose kinase [Trueperaceae bacterium]|nr:MAG: xylulose kinase [Trueperaceae bacterium]
MTQPALLGLDLGTSSVKALLLGLDGAVLGTHAVAYPDDRPRPGWSEQDPEAWWRSTCAAVHGASEAAAREHGAVEVVGIGLSGQMHTFVLVDEALRPLRPAITWMDTRAESLLPRVRAAIDEAGLADALANPVVLGLSLLPLVWLREHEPAVLERAHAFLVAKDVVRARLTGVAAGEPTDASATLLCDVPKRAWSQRAADVFDLPAAMFPPLGESAASAGALRASAAAELGLPPGLPVAFGAGDQQAAAVGMGTLRPGDAQLMVGTGAQALAVREGAERDPTGRLHTFCHVEGFVQQASVNNAGAALEWVRSLLGLSWSELYAAPVRRAGLPAFVPYLTGERTPVMKGHARGAWLGVGASHDAEALAGAAVAGVVTSIRDGVAALRAHGAPPREIRGSGGGLRVAGFAQAVADALETPLTVVEQGSASGVGAALLGGVAAGVYADLVDASARAAHADAVTYEPSPDAADLWRARSAWRLALDGLGFHEHVASRPESAAVTD